MKITVRQRLSYIAGDLIACEAATLIFNLARHWRIHADRSIDFATWSTDPHVELSYLAFPCVMLAVFGLLGFYNDPSYKSRYEALFNSILGSLIGSLIIYFAIIVNDSLSGRILHYSLLAILCVAYSLSVAAVRFFVRAILLRVASQHNAYNVVVVGQSGKAERFARKLEKHNSRMGFHVVGLLCEDCPDQPNKCDYPVISSENLETFIIEKDIKAFVVLASKSDQNHSVEMINRMYSYGCTILIPLEFYNVVTSRPKLSNIVGEPLVDITTPALSPMAANFKRIGDILFSALAMIVLSPLVLVIACLVKHDSPGPVFYRQERVGLHRRKFNLIKFRSMIVDSEPDGPLLCHYNDNRVTRLGRVLRKYRIDEIPQFWNVFRGDMSLVGPRPEREFFLNELAQREPAVFTLHNVRPGITSLGVVKFGYATDVDQMTKRLQFDLLYVENISFSLDLRVMFHTINTIITGKGI